MNAPELKIESLRAQVRKLLRTQIVLGELTGDRLYAVPDIARKLGISASPVREALNDLENAGLISIKRNRGFVVRHLHDQELDDIFELRLLMEVPVMTKISNLMTPESHKRCAHFVETCLEAAKQGDLVGFLEEDRKFHHELLAITGNERLVSIVDNLRDQARLPGLKLVLESGSLISSAEEHFRILELLAAGDGRGARTAMKNHLTHTRGIWAGLDEQHFT